MKLPQVNFISGEDLSVMWEGDEADEESYGVEDCQSVPGDIRVVDQLTICFCLKLG